MFALRAKNRFHCCSTIKHAFHLRSLVLAEGFLQQVKDNLAQTSQQLIPAVFTNTWGKARLQQQDAGLSTWHGPHTFPLCGYICRSSSLWSPDHPPPSFSFPPSCWASQLFTRLKDSHASREGLCSLSQSLTQWQFTILENQMMVFWKIQWLTLSNLLAMEEHL